MTRVAIVTGGATRIGAYISENLAKNGWKIAIHYNESEKSAREVNDKINTISQSIIIQKNFLSQSNFDDFFDEIISDLGVPTLLINNASFFRQDNILSVEEESIKNHMQVNLFVPLLLIKKMLEIKDSLERNVINILDNSIDLYNSKSFLSYSLSKTSMHNVMQLIISQVTNSNFRINAISPGFVLKPDGETDEEFERRIKNSKKKTRTTLDEITRAIEFILENKDLNGQDIRSFDFTKG